MTSYKVGLNHTGVRGYHPRQHHFESNPSHSQKLHDTIGKDLSIGFLVALVSTPLLSGDLKIPSINTRFKGHTTGRDCWLAATEKSYRPLRRQLPY